MERQLLCCRIFLVVFRMLQVLVLLALEVFSIYFLALTHDRSVEPNMLAATILVLVVNIIGLGCCIMLLLYTAWPAKRARANCSYTYDRSWDMMLVFMFSVTMVVRLVKVNALLGIAGNGIIIVLFVLAAPVSAKMVRLERQSRTLPMTVLMTCYPTPTAGAVAAGSCSGNLATADAAGARDVAPKATETAGARVC